MTRMSRDCFCPAPECEAQCRTMEGLHDHISRKHDGKSLRQLRREADEYYNRNNADS